MPHTFVAFWCMQDRAREPYGYPTLLRAHVFSDFATDIGLLADRRSVKSKSHRGLLLRDARKPRMAPMVESMSARTRSPNQNTGCTYHWPIVSSSMAAKTATNIHKSRAKPMPHPAPTRPYTKRRRILFAQCNSNEQVEKNGEAGQTTVFRQERPSLTVDSTLFPGAHATPAAVGLTILGTYPRESGSEACCWCCNPVCTVVDEHSEEP